MPLRPDALPNRVRNIDFNVVDQKILSARNDLKHEEDGSSSNDFIEAGPSTQVDHFEQEDAEVLEGIMKNAKEGQVFDQLLLGFMYRDGSNGLVKDYQQAMDWFLEASKQGDADAQYNVGEMYWHGLSVPPSHEDALGWYKKAANQGQTDAQYCLGIIYLHGRGVPVDYQKAMEWTSKAAIQGHAAAQNNRKVMSESGPGILETYIHPWGEPRRPPSDDKLMPNATLSFCTSTTNVASVALAIPSTFRIGSRFSRGNGFDDVLVVKIMRNVFRLFGNRATAEMSPPIAQKRSSV